MSILKKIFGIKEKDSITVKTDLNHENSDCSELDKFKSKNASNRMKEIMILGDTGKQNVFHILEYAVLNDKDPGVVMAGLKRLPNFKDNSPLISLLEKFKSEKNTQEYEPYFSMILLNLNLITEEEFGAIFK